VVSGFPNLSPWLKHLVSSFATGSVCADSGATDMIETRFQLPSKAILKMLKVNCMICTRIPANGSQSSIDFVPVYRKIVCKDKQC